jgi:hypothetical protein
VLAGGILRIDRQLDVPLGGGNAVLFVSELDDWDSL